MGWKYEVNGYFMTRDGYEYQQVYAGDSLLTAVFAMWKCKRGGCGCVKLEWR